MKAKRFDRKSLKNRLACIMMIYMDGLNEKKKNKLKNYIDDKLENVVDYYVRLLKRKKISQINSTVNTALIEKLCAEIGGTTQVEKANKEEMVVQ